MIPFSPNQKQALKDLPVSLKLDLYAEVVIASLIEQGKVDPEKLYIRPKGTFYRNYRADLEKIEVLEDKNTEQISVFVDINREGLYDMLPEGVFHKNLEKSQHIDTQETTQELKMHQEEEKNARKLFLPLEQMFYRQRIAIEIEEQKSLIGLSEAIVDELIHNFWNIPLPLSHYQSLCLAYMLPMLHQIVGNWDLTKQCLEILLQQPVSITRGTYQAEQVQLSENALGAFTLGNSFMLQDLLTPELTILVIRVGPLMNDKITDFLRDGRKKAYLNLLASYFIPATLDWKIDIIADPEHEMFRLGDISEKGLLNYTTVL